MTKSSSLGYLLEAWLVDSSLGDIEICDLAIDSREIKPSSLFLAYPGAEHDGREFIAQAISAGASAVVIESGWDLKDLESPVPIISLPDVRAKTGVIANRFFDRAADNLFIVGITGTNGKTSCAHLLAQAFSGLGVRSGLVGTLGWGFLENLQHGELTTPDPISLHRKFSWMREHGATHVCMEVSSHALAQDRVEGVSFDAALFTNLTHDHLDYHGDLDAYADAKARLFSCESLRFAVINQDDEFGRKLSESVNVPVSTYGLQQCDVRASKVNTGLDGLELEIETGSGPIKALTKLVGRINTHNVLAVASVLLADGKTISMIARALNNLDPVPGRMELFQKDKGLPAVVIDYAHTPDALERALMSVREHCAGQLWCVFGCGGDRDRAKRPLMGAIAQRLSDVPIVTDDNPRHESPVEITDQIVAGMTIKPCVINDRVAAIEWAIDRAHSLDWILVAGKGHETTQQIGDNYIQMDDRSIVSQCLGVAA